MGTFLTCILHTVNADHSFAANQPASGETLLFSAQALEMRDVSKQKIDVQESSENSNLISTEQPVDLIAEQVEYDEVKGMVSAIGNVELVQAGRIVHAEKITYSIPQDIVQASGNVVLNEVTGETYFADNVELKDQMKDGFVTGLNGILVDGSRFSAEEAEKIADLKVIMQKASYTACEPCKADPARNPMWQIKAREVIHHKDEKRVSYEDATFEVAGIPVAYTPYFSHSDGTVERKSGFLMPRVGFDSELGGIYDQSYYWNIAPDKDATIGAMIMTDVAPLVQGEYRQKFENAEILLNGGLTYSDRTDRDGDNEFQEDNQVRGHLDVDGLWNINEKWRAGTALEIVSDSQYLRQYNISNEDVLENKVFLERFDGRDYATVNVIRFKDVRVSDRKVDQPSVLPEIYSRFIGNPNSLMGGRGSLELSALGLHREGEDQDIARGSVGLGWERRHESHWGLVQTLNLLGRGDAYQVNDSDTAGETENDQSSAFRGFANAHYEVSYPLAREFQDKQWVIEPVGAMTLGTNLNDDDDIPNEDSQDVFLDATNIFNPNRYPGFDRIEDDSRVTYGLRSGLYSDNGYQGEIFFGQSYRLDDDDENVFPEGSGLSEKESDFVGNLSIRAGSHLNLNYALQLENENLSSQRHEVNAIGRLGPVELGARYFYANALQGTDLDQSREQIRNTLRLDLTDEWSLIGATQYDLARETEGLRRVSYGLDYQGQCVTFLINGERKLTRDSTGDSGTQIMMRLGLKNLGEFETTGFTIGEGE